MSRTVWIDGARVALAPAALLGQGGEAEVYDLGDGRVLKWWKPPEHPDFDGMPTSRHEAACASGSVAILAATAEIEAGRYETACVVGLEMMRNVSGQQAAQNLGAAAWTGHEFQDAQYLWPRAFSDLGEEYDRRFG